MAKISVFTGAFAMIWNYFSFSPEAAITISRLSLGPLQPKKHLL